MLISVIEEAPTQVLAHVGAHMLNHRYSDPYDFFSPHPAKTMFLFADGSARGLAWSTHLFVLQDLATRAGGEPNRAE